MYSSIRAVTWIIKSCSWALRHEMLVDGESNEFNFSECNVNLCRMPLCNHAIDFMNGTSRRCVHLLQFQEFVFAGFSAQWWVHFLLSTWKTKRFEENQVNKMSECYIYIHPTSMRLRLLPLSVKDHPSWYQVRWAIHAPLST